MQGTAAVDGGYICRVCVRLVHTSAAKTKQMPPAVAKGGDMGKVAAENEIASFDEKVEEMHTLKLSLRKGGKSDDEIATALDEWEDNNFCRIDLHDPRSLYEFWRLVDDIVQKSSTFNGEDACDHFGIAETIYYTTKDNVSFHFGIFFVSRDLSIGIWFDNKSKLPKKWQKKFLELSRKDGEYFDSVVDDDGNTFKACFEKDEKSVEEYDGGFWFLLKKERFQQFINSAASVATQRKILQSFFDEVTALFKANG